MEENKNIPTTEGEAIAPEAPVTDIPGTDAPSPDLTAGVPQQEQAGATMTEPGDVVVSFDKIEELMAERRAAARDTVEKAEPAAPEVDAPAVEPVDPIPDAKAAEKATEEKPQEEVAAEQKKPRRGRPPKAEKAAPEQAKPPKAGKTHAAPEEKAAPPAPEVPPTPRDATRAEKEEIVYLDLSDLHPFKDHPFGVRDDAEMKSLVESVRNGGVNQPALVRPREGGGYEIIAGHRRQMASQLAGYRNMPCIVRNMTDDEAILAMTDDNLRQRETILPSEKAMSLKMQYEAIKHQGARGDSAEAGKLSLESVGQRNGMSVKTVQRYIWLNDLVPELKQTMDDGKLSFTPAVEISRVRPKHQKYIAVSIEGQQASPSKGQAKRLRELDKENKLSPDVIDGILCEEKKKEDRDVIITGAELEKFFGKEATPRQMKDQIMTLLEDWKERQPPELAKPDKKMDMEK